MPEQQKAIIIGATSGIGRALAKELDSAGYQLAVCGRREQLLDSLCDELGNPAIKQVMDVSKQEQAIEQLESLFEQMQDVDLVVLNAGVAHMDPGLSWKEDASLIAVNVSGFTALAGASFRYFCKQKQGHIVGISSILTIRGGMASAYGASKAYMTSYMEGLRYHFAKKGLPIAVTDIRPGFVDTGMPKGNLFWMSTPERAANDIYRAIKKRKKVAYITPKWRLIAWLMKLMPDSLYHRI